MPTTHIELPEELFEFVRTPDRGQSAVFVGRAEELNRLADYAAHMRSSSSLERAGGGHTVLFEACPGMGKTALLAQFRKHAESVGLPAINLTHHDLTSHDAFAARLRFGLKSTIQRQAENVEAAGVAEALLPVASSLGGDRVGATLSVVASATAAIRKLGDALRKNDMPPLAVTIDEAAHLDRQHRTVMLQLHEATLGWPVFPVCAGTAGAREAMKLAGVYRFSEGHTPSLAPMSMTEARDAFPAMCERFGIGMGTHEENRWADRVAKDSAGFPQHINIGLKATAAELLAANEQARHPSLNQAAKNAGAGRDKYYKERLGSVLPEHGEALWAGVAALRRAGGQTHRDRIETVFRHASDKARTRRKRPPLPQGEVGSLVDRAIGNGVFQRTGQGSLELSIPSMGDYIERVFGGSEAVS